MAGKIARSAQHSLKKLMVAITWIALYAIVNFVISVAKLRDVGKAVVKEDIIKRVFAVLKLKDFCRKNQQFKRFLRRYSPP